MKRIIDFIENTITAQEFFAFLYEDDALESSLESVTNLPAWARDIADNLYLFLISGNPSDEHFISSARELLEQFLENNSIPYQHNSEWDDNLDIVLSSYTKWAHPPVSYFAPILEQKELSRKRKWNSLKTRSKQISDIRIYCSGKIGDVVEFISVKQAAEQWGISDRRVRILCEQGKIDGVHKKGRFYLIPANAVKPIDGRTLRGVNIPEEYAALFSHIDALKGELDKRRPLTQGELNRLQEEFLIEFTYHSNAIEGNTLTLRETALVLDGVVIDGKPLKDHLEAVGHRDAFLYVQRLVSDRVPISEKVIKDVHALVLMNRPEDRGVYRSIPVRIMGAYKEPPQASLVPIQMEQLCHSNAKDKRHPIEYASLFHLDFEGIHPFIDGNGRTGRLILNLMLMKNGYPPINVKFADRKRYYDCFDTYDRDNSSSLMVNMVAEYLKERMEQCLDLLK